MRILVTGAAGFIGFHLSRRLIARGDVVIGIDNLNDYYNPLLKQARLDSLEKLPGFSFERLDLVDRSGMETLFARSRFDCVVHLAAQAGVRHSLVDPHAYVASNLVGFVNVLEGCRQSSVGHLVYASSSSVYGMNSKLPYSEHDPVDHPLNLYAATKKSNELLAHSYSHLFHIPMTGLRFFTVYGPWGRPDMAYWTFAEDILAGKPITLFNQGHMRRDFTFIDDVIEGVMRILDSSPVPNPHWGSEGMDPATSTAPFRIYNIGNSDPIELSRFVAALESSLGKRAVVTYAPMQPGDVIATSADMTDLQHAVGYSPTTTIEAGVRQFCSWLKEYRAYTHRTNHST